MFRNKVVLVTGGAGFIGSHIVDRLIDAGAEKVIAFDNLVSGSTCNFAHLDGNDRFRFVSGDVRKVDEIAPLVKESDFVFHEAASKLVVSLENPRLDMETNIIGTLNVLDAARDSDPVVVHASTGSVFGSSDVPMSEEYIQRPTTLYGISKLAGEKYVQFYAREFGLKACVLRYFHVYGPRQDYHGDAGVVSIFLSRVLSGKSPIVYGSGEQVRCFTYVGDDVDANILLARKGKCGESYNVASKTRISVKDLAKLIVDKYATKTMSIKYASARQGENLRPIPDTSKVEALGFRAKVSFDDGLGYTKKWVEEDLDSGAVL